MSREPWCNPRPRAGEDMHKGQEGRRQEIGRGPVLYWATQWLLFNSGQLCLVGCKKISELKAPCVMKVGFKTNLGVQPRHLTPKCKMQARVKSVSTPIQIAFKTSVLLRATKLATPNLISNAHTCEASESKPKATHRVHAQTNATVCGCLCCRLLLEAHTICLDPGPWTFG